MREAGIAVTRKQDYIRLFPTNHGWTWKRRRSTRGGWRAAVPPT